MKCTLVGWVAFAAQVHAAAPARSWPKPERLAGDVNIAPSREVAAVMVRQLGLASLHGTYKVCMMVEGNVRSVTPMVSSGLAGYDAQVAATVQATWRYAPYRINGVLRPVCTAVTFNFRYEGLADRVIAVDSRQGLAHASLVPAPDVLVRQRTLSREFLVARVWVCSTDAEQARRGIARRSGEPAWDAQVQATLARELRAAGTLARDCEQVAVEYRIHADAATGVPSTSLPTPVGER